MATSHYCNGKWRDGPLSDCPKHAKLSSTQATVHRGKGSPGGLSSKEPKSSGSAGGSGSASSGSSKGSSGSE